MPHFDEQGIQVNYRVHPLQRPALPRLHFFPDSIGHLGYQRRTDFHTIDLLQMALNLTRRHSPRIHRQDLVVESIEPSLMFGNNLRLVLSGAIPRHFNLDLAEIPF